MINGLNNGSNSTVNSGKNPAVESSKKVITSGDNSGSEKIKEAARLSKVEEIKKQVELGEYELNMDKAAQKVVETLLF